MDRKRKLIKAALPLDAINKASAREKSIRHGHPSTLHLWWARRPLVGLVGRRVDSILIVSMTGHHNSVHYPPEIATRREADHG